MHCGINRKIMAQIPIFDRRHHIGNVCSAAEKGLLPVVVVARTPFQARKLPEVLKRRTWAEMTNRERPKAYHDSILLAVQWPPSYQCLAFLTFSEPGKGCIIAASKEILLVSDCRVQQDRYHLVSNIGFNTVILPRAYLLKFG